MHIPRCFLVRGSQLTPSSQTQCATRTDSTSPSTQEAEQYTCIKVKTGKAPRHLVATTQLLTSTRYHWALFVGPKHETAATYGTRFHALERLTRQEDGTTKSAWQFEEKELPTSPAGGILVRILVAKVHDRHQLQQLLQESHVPIRQGQEGWNCIAWVQEALDVLVASENVLGAGVTDWRAIREAAMSYVAKKKEEHRFDVRADQGRFDSSLVPTFDMIRGQEAIP